MWSNGIGAWVPARRAVMTAAATWVMGASIERILRRCARLGAPPDGEYGRASVIAHTVRPRRTCRQRVWEAGGTGTQASLGTVYFPDSLTAACPVLHLWSDRRAIRTDPDPQKRLTLRTITSTHARKMQSRPSSCFIRVAASHMCDAPQRSLLLHY
jgi:hypothetical protein